MSVLPVLMGIVNVTPDSFSDGGLYGSVRAAVAHGVQLASEGALWLDIGGESTRPGAEPVSEFDEMRRVVPVIEGLRRALPEAVLSVDTRKAAVAAAALDAGARIVNDVSALDDPQMAELVASRGANVVLMHMRGQPKTMQSQTAYADLIGEVEAHLLERAGRLRALGVPKQRILLDPGVGFGKALDANPALIAAVPRLRSHGYRVLIGASRKGFIGELTGVSDPSARVHGSVGAALAAASRGADVLRVHDVSATLQALQVFMAVEGA